MTFYTRFAIARRAFGPLCLGIDPSADVLARWGCPNNTDGLERFADYLLARVEGRIGIVKPQIAFFERFGSVGLAVLERMNAVFRSRGTLVLIDAKRGDIGSTCAGYAQAFFAPDSPLRSDAVTATAYLGHASLRPLLDAARAADGCVFVVVKSSNPEGKALQGARERSGISVAHSLARAVAAYNQEDPARPACGAVVGAMHLPDDPMLLEQLGQSLILAPGIGPQGASFDDLRRCAVRHNVIPPVSRQVLLAGARGDAFQRELDACRESARRALGEQLAGGDS